jgi:GT2 family glycosyltransferase
MTKRRVSATNCSEEKFSWQSPRVSIIVPVSIPDNIEMCLRSIERTKYPNLEIVVIVNGSPDVIAHIVSNLERAVASFPTSMKKRTKIIVHQEALGYAVACNRGFKDSTGKYVIFVNDDAVVEPNCVGRLVRVGEKDSNIACVQPKILSFHNPDSFEYAGAAGGFIDFYGVPFCAGRIFDVIEKDRGQYNNINEIFWASGVALFCRSSIIVEVGLFDEEFFSYMEEIDFAFRVLRAGYRIVFASAAKVFHLGSVTAKKMKVDRDFLSYRNNILMLLKNYELKDLMSVILPRLFMDTFNFVERLRNRKVKRAMNIPRAYLDLIIHKLRYICTERVRLRRLKNVDSDHVKKRIFPKSIALLYKLRRFVYFHQIRNLIPCEMEARV